MPMTTVEYIEELLAEMPDNGTLQNVVQNKRELLSIDVTHNLTDPPRVTRHGFRKEPLARAIARKGEKLLEEIIPKDSEAKGRRTITWKLFRGLAGSVVDRIMPKVLLSQIHLHVPAATHRNW